MSAAEFRNNKDRSVYLINIRKHLLRKSSICPLCLKAINNMKDASIDHILPTSKGGSDHISNLQATHIWCNSAKAAKN